MTMTCRSSSRYPILEIQYTPLQKLRFLLWCTVLATVYFLGPRLSDANIPFLLLLGLEVDVVSGIGLRKNPSPAGVVDPGSCTAGEKMEGRDQERRMSVGYTRGRWAQPDMA